MSREVTDANLVVRPFDPAEFLTTPEQIDAFLMVESETGDPRKLAHALGIVARAKSSIAKVAEAAGVTSQGLRKALARDGNPSLIVVAKAAEALGYRVSLTPIAGGAPKATGRRAHTEKIADSLLSRLRPTIIHEIESMLRSEMVDDALRSRASELPKRKKKAV